MKSTFSTWKGITHWGTTFVEMVRPFAELSAAVQEWNSQEICLCRGCGCERASAAASWLGTGSGTAAYGIAWQLLPRLSLLGATQT